MPRLTVNSDGTDKRAFELKLGTNHIGRGPDNDLQIDHPTISTHHCDLIWSDGGVRVRDRDSTNGTFINDQPVKEAELRAGDLLRLGEVELAVESVDVNVAVPEIKVAATQASVILPDGAMSCLNHSASVAYYQCTACAQFFCPVCIRLIRRVGGVPLKLCPCCSSHCELLPGFEKRRKKWWHFDWLKKTLKMRTRV